MKHSNKNDHLALTLLCHRLWSICVWLSESQVCLKFRALPGRGVYCVFCMAVHLRKMKRGGRKQIEQKAIPFYRCVLELKTYKHMKNRRVNFLYPTKSSFLRTFVLYFYGELISNSRNRDIEKYPGKWPPLPSVPKMYGSPNCSVLEIVVWCRKSLFFG